MDLESLSSARIVDLSVALSERLPGTWPGHMTYAHHNWNWFAEVEGPTGRTRTAAPYQTNFLVIDEHCGTHFDAPTHFVPPPDSGLPLAGPLGSETGDRVPPADLTGPAAVVDVRALSEESQPGVSPFITDEHVRAFEEENGELREGEVVLLRTGWDRYYVEGEEGLSRGLRYVEVLTNLSELPTRGAYFVFLPLNISGSSGGPGRAIALVPDVR